MIWDSPFDSASEWTTDGDSPNSIWETNQYQGFLVGNAYEGTGALSLTALPNEIRNEFNTNGIMDMGTEYWLGWAYKIVTDTDDLRPFIQIRQIPGSSTNAFTMRCTSSGQITINTSTDPAYADVAVGGSGGAHQEYTYTDRTLGQWHVLVMNVNWHYQNGFIKVWIDGDLKVDKTGTTTYRRDSNGDILPGQIYSKIGPYPSTYAKIGEIHYDRYRIWEGPGGSYEAVHPLGLSPAGQVASNEIAKKKTTAIIIF